jgi:ABC-type glutathione transport system ATPase component
MLKAELKEISVKGKGALLLNVKFELKENCINTILGLNGSGKTTLIKSLTGLLNPEFYNVDGNVMYRGIDILKLDEKDMLTLRRGKIKYVMQDALNSFDKLKTFEYYFEKIAKYKNEVEPVLEYFLLPAYGELKKLYPYEISGGMAQRINFALVLLTHPELIILDEPTSSIDIAISNLFLLKLKEFAAQKNHSVLLVTHDIDFTEKISDEIALLSNNTLSRFYRKEEFFSAGSLNGKGLEFNNSGLLKSFLNSRNQLSS